MLIDSSFLYALYNTDDDDHEAALQVASGQRDTALIPMVVLPEVAYLFKRDVGYWGVLQFMKALASINPHLVPLENTDLQRAYEIARQYHDAEFDLVDCCIMALSERLNVTRICTFDRRDFPIFRPRHCVALELLP